MSKKHFLFLVIFSCILPNISSNEVQKCGLGKSEFGGLIAGGEPTARGDWPWLVALIHRKHGNFFCGGSLISAKHVLSASHCFQHKCKAEILPSYFLEVLVGKYNLSDENETGSRRVLVREIVIHPDWKYDQEEFDADIAILFLEDEQPLNSFVRPVCLPSKSSIAVTGTGSVVGWGAMENSQGHHVPTPFELEVPAIDGNRCYPIFKKLAGYASPRMFCGGYANESKSVCGGDSGGGFYSLNDDRSAYTIRGIVSGGLKATFGTCEVNAYSLYTNVAEFIDWITEVMKRKLQWLKVDFSCEFVQGYGYSCRYPSNEPITSNSTFSTSNLSRTSDVTTLEIDFSSSDHVLPGVGKEFSTLKNLEIRGAMIKSVERRAFANMTRLTLLTMEGMSLDLLPENLLADLPNLERVYFINCKIENIPEKFFSYQKNMKKLILSENSIMVLHKGLFESSLKLQELDLTGNSLKSIYVDFTKLRAIERIFLIGNSCLDLLWERVIEKSIGKFQLEVRSRCTAQQTKQDI